MRKKIKIIAEKFNFENNEYLKVKNIHMLKEDVLPTHYINHMCVYYNVEQKHTGAYGRVNNQEKFSYILEENEIYTEKEFNEKLDFIKQCAKRLSIIDKQNRQPKQTAHYVI